MAINLDHVTEQITVTDTAANASLTVNPKGTGAFNVAAGSGGLNLSNGGTVTAITRTNAGTSFYTSQPSCAITAPTTAGGVQATGTANMYADQGTTVSAGGSGYTVGDVLTLVGGTPLSSAATYSVATVSAGVVLTVTAVNFAAYSVLPSSPVSTTGGTGTGCTLNVQWKLNNVTITAAGSGYVEQPTVTFSGGGGSGAAAYATVGSAVILKSIGGTLDLSTTNGIGLRIYDSGGTVPSSGYWAASSGTSSPFLWARGGTNTPGLITSSGTGAISIQTNSGSQTQFVVTHTASAVNYVQVTGAATGANPNISAQGSDSSISVNLTSKGAGDVRLITGGSTGWVRLFPNGTEVVRATGVASGVNYINFTGSVASTSPSMASAGSDTNIDLTLTPKGTGNVRFGTHTGTADTAISGYIEIKDSGGTIRKLAVIT
jgi:hypothetical protein